MAAEMMSGDLPVTSDADAVAKQKAKEAEMAAGGTMLASGSTKRKADQVRYQTEPHFDHSGCSLPSGPVCLETTRSLQEWGEVVHDDAHSLFFDSATWSAVLCITEPLHGPRP